MKLKYTIPLLGLFLSCAIITIEYISLSSNLASREIAFARKTLTNTANSLQGNLNTSLANGDMVTLKQSISDVNFLSSAQLVYLLDEHDIIVHSGQLGIISKKSIDTPLPVSPALLKKVRENMNGEILTVENGKILQAVYPIIMGQKAGEFRPTRIGIMVIDYDLSFNLASLHSSVMSSTIEIGIVILIMLIVGGIAIHNLLTIRVANILNTAQMYLNGERSARVNLSGNDELATISKAFDDVADSVEIAEAEIRVRQDSLNDAQRIAHLGNWEWDIASGALFWSDEIYRIFGYEPDEFASTYDAFVEAIHPDDQELVTNAVGKALEDKSSYHIEHRVVRPDGQERFVKEMGELKLDENGEPKTMSGTVLDITEIQIAQQKISDLNVSLEERVQERTKELKTAIAEQEQTQLLLQYSEASMKAIVSTAADGIITINETGQISSFNTAAENLFGWSVMEAIGKNVSMLMPKSDADHHDAYLNSFKETGVSKIIGKRRELTGKRKDNTEFSMDLAVSIAEVGSQIMYTGIIKDISERKEFEAELERKEKRLRDTLDNMPGAIVFTDSENNIIVCNNRYAAICEVPEKYLAVGSSYEGVFRFRAERGDYGPGDTNDLVKARLNSLLNPSKETFEDVTPSGHIHEVRRRPAKGGGVVTVITDITERKLAEKKLHQAHEDLKHTQDDLVQAEKMASLGGLVAGVAHEINTPVGVSVTAASHLSHTTSKLSNSFELGEMKKSDLTDYLEGAEQSSNIILSNLERASSLISSFKKVAVDQSSEDIREFRIAEYLDEVILSLHPKLKKAGQEVAVTCDPNILLNTYPGAISQIVTNLIMNSLIHGFGDGNTGDIRIAVTAENRIITLEHSDTGKGMDKETLSKVFDPFFTTNRGGGGSGLGMHIIYNLITKTLAGKVNCQSSPGNGSKFTIFFPQDVTLPQNTAVAS